jgi:hypothetical protein
LLRIHQEKEAEASSSKPRDISHGIQISRKPQKAAAQQHRKLPVDVGNNDE